MSASTTGVEAAYPFLFSESSDSTPERTVISVAQANGYIKQLLEGDVLLASIWIEGEISNLKDYGDKGQLYFTLKDADSQINCVMFGGARKGLPEGLSDGQKILAKGKIGVYHKRGYYNFQVFYIELAGQGALSQAFDILKKKLFAEGLFDDSRKKPLPKFPESIGVLSAPNGAAVRDIMQIARRRNPDVQLYVIPSLVQGEAAPASIIKGIALAEKFGKLDLLILARGGGSIEDLWAFNDEGVARAIADCELPVVSAIGHEVDYTIADFVSDLRAPTPSAAAELCIPEKTQMLLWVDESYRRLVDLLGHFNLRTSERIESLEVRLSEGLEYVLHEKQEALQYIVRQLELLNPLQILGRGYSVTQDAETGHILRNAKQVKVGDMLETILSSGTIESRVERSSH